MSHLEYQSEMIKNISDMISKEKEKLDEMFSDFIKKMTIENPVINNYNSIDKLLIDSNPDAKTFYESFIENDVELLYWYDMNEKKFINKIHKYDAKIIKKYEFDIYLEKNLFHNNPVKNLINIPMTELFTYCCNRCCGENYSELSTMLVNDPYQHRDDPNIKHKYIKIQNNCGNSGHRSVVMKKEKRQPNIKISLYLDVNLNIIIPEIKTIIINNYVPFSIYCLYSIQHIINKSNNIILNQYSSDCQVFNDIEKVKKACDKYINSVHQRDLFNDGTLFSHILNFFEYDNIIKNIKPHLLFQNAIKLDKSHEIEEKYKQQIAELIEDYENKIKIITQEREDIYKKYALEVNLIKFNDMIDNTINTDITYENN
jgi:hypothetical protein